MPLPNRYCLSSREVADALHLQLREKVRPPIAVSYNWEGKVDSLVVYSPTLNRGMEVTVTAGAVRQAIARYLRVQKVKGEPTNLLFYRTKNTRQLRYMTVQMV